MVNESFGVESRQDNSWRISALVSIVLLQTRGRQPPLLKLLATVESRRSVGSVLLEICLALSGIETMTGRRPGRSDPLAQRRRPAVRGQLR